MSCLIHFNQTEIAGNNQHRHNKKMIFPLSLFPDNRMMIFTLYYVRTNTIFPWNLLVNLGSWLYQYLSTHLLCFVCYSVDNQMRIKCVLGMRSYRHFLTYTNFVICFHMKLCAREVVWFLIDWVWNVCIWILNWKQSVACLNVHGYVISFDGTTKKYFLLKIKDTTYGVSETKKNCKRNFLVSILYTLTSSVLEDYAIRL